MMIWSSLPLFFSLSLSFFSLRKVFSPWKKVTVRLVPVSPKVYTYFTTRNVCEAARARRLERARWRTDQARKLLCRKMCSVLSD